MLTLHISEAVRRPTQIGELNYEMYHYPDALVQKRFHSVYLKAIAPELSCQKIGLYVSLSRQKVSAFIKLYNQSGIQSLKFGSPKNVMLWYL